MNEVDVTLWLVRALSEMNAEYVISGSFASNLWGEPRATRDVDIVYAPASLDLGEFRRRVENEFELDPQMRVEAITGTLRHVATHRRTGFQAELFLLSDDPFDRSRFARRRAVKFGDTEVYFLTAEDIVVQKLRWLARGGEQKHREDLRKLLAVQQANLDWAYVRRWTAEHRTDNLLNDLLANLDKP